MLKYSLVFILLLILLSACSLFVKTDVAKEELLLQHLQRWRSFRLKGIAEVSFNQFRLRKNVHINRTEDSLNISLFDSGIFGLRPTPFMTIDIDSGLSISLPDNFKNSIGGLPDENDLNIAMINSLIDELEDNRREIVKNGKLMIKDSIIAFNREMMIDSIEFNNNEDEILLQFDYRSADLSGIEFFLNNNRLLEVSVDTITFTSD